MRATALVTCMALAGLLVAGCVQTQPLRAEGAGGGPMPSHGGPSCRHSSFEWREPGLFEAARSLPAAALRQRQGVIDHPEFGSWYHGMALESAAWSDGAGRRLHFAPLENGTGVSVYPVAPDWTDDDRERFVAVVGALIPASQAELHEWADESHPHDIADGADLRFVQVPRATDPARLMETLEAGAAATAGQSPSGVGYVTLAWPEWELRMVLPSIQLAGPMGEGFTVDGADLVRIEVHPEVLSPDAGRRVARDAFAELGLPEPSFRQWAATDC